MTHFLTMYLAFNPQGAIDTARNLLLGAVTVFAGYKLVAAIGFGRVSAALVGLFMGAIAYMAISSSLIPEIGKWALAQVGL